MRSQLAKFTQQEDINEHLLIITTILAYLTKDVENTINFLTHTASGTRRIITHLFPLEKIIRELKETATHLTKRLHFPFKVENWQTIQKYMTVNAY